MPPDYSLLRDDDTSAVINALPEAMKRLAFLVNGEPLRDKFPAGSPLCFSENYRQLRKLYDFVANTLRTHFVSEKVKQVMEGLGATNCEFIPITLLNHKGKPASRVPYYLLNVLGSEDALDMEKTEAVMHPSKKGQVLFFKRLVLKRENISPKALLFRAKTKMDEYFVSQALQEAFQREGITGYRLIPAEGWDGNEVY